MREFNEAESIEALSFTDIFDLHEIQKLQDAFSAATGVPSIITEPDGTPLIEPSGFISLCQDIVWKSEKGLSNCRRNDPQICSPNPGSPNIKPCIQCGLASGGCSIMFDGRHIATWVVGPVLTEVSSEEDLLRYADLIGVDRVLYLQELRKLDLMNSKRFQDVCDYLCVNVQMLFKYAHKNQQLSLEIQRSADAEFRLRTVNNQLKKRASEKAVLLEETNCELNDLNELLEEETVERERSEKLVRKLNLELENRVMQRTQQLDGQNHRLNDANTLFANIYDSSPEVIVFALDREYRYISFNERCKQTMRLLSGKEIALGASILEIFDGDEDWYKAKVDFDRALSGERFTLLTVNGDEEQSRIHWQNHCAPIIDSEGAIVGLSCFMLNITDRIEAKQDLAAREKLYSTIFHQSAIAVELYDVKGLITNANGASFDLFGVNDLSDLNGLNIFQNPNVTDEAKIRLLNQETVRFESDFDFSRTPYKSRHQGHRTFYWQISPLIKGNRTTGYIGQIQDFTEQSKAKGETSVIAANHLKICYWPI